jgi:peptidoglycan biosynthesis protein MviN/MurJ (putative lipid II flippase)
VASGALLVASTELFREAAIAARFGALPGLDSFFGVWIVPTVLIGIGTYLGKLVVVPVATARLEGAEKRSGAEVARAADAGGGGRPVRGQAELGRLVIWVVFLSILSGLLLALAAPLVARVALPGLAVEMRADGARTLQRLSGFLTCGLIAAFLMALLQARRRFVVAAYSTALPSVAVVAGVLWPGATIARLGWMFSVGALLQVTWLWFAAGRAQLGVVAPWSWSRPDRTSHAVPGTARDREAPRVDDRRELPSAGRQMLRLAWAPALMMAARSLTLVADRAWASYLDPGSVACLNYAYRLAVGVRVLVTGTAFTVGIPFLAMLLARGEEAAMARLVRRSLRAIVLVLAPIAAGLLLFSQDAVALLLMRGRFDPAGAVLTGQTLAVMAQTLIPDSLFALLAAPLFARQQPTAPMWIIVCTVPLHLLLVWPAARFFGLPGIAATGWLVLVVALLLLWRHCAKTGPVLGAEGWNDLRGAALGSAAVWALGWGVRAAGVMPSMTASWGTRFVALVVLGAALLAVYALVLVRFSSLRSFAAIQELIRGRSTH